MILCCVLTGFALETHILIGRHYLLAGLPCDSIAHIELASLDSVYKSLIKVHLLGLHLSV